MDSLNIRNAHWKEERIIPKTSWKIRGYSRSAYRTGFYLPDLDLMLDAGPQNFNKPTHIFITHTHADHIMGLAGTMIGDEDGDHIFHIYGIDSAKEYIKNYVKAMFEANAMTGFDMDGVEWFNYNSLKKGDEIRFTIKNSDLIVNVFKCDHKIPTISYGFSEIKQKLKEQYKGLNGKEIQAIRKSGVEITENVTFKRFAYVCDTSINVFTMNPEILDYPVIMIECTFLYDDELDNAVKTQHIHWSQLKHYVKNNPQIQFLLFHFSLRYRDAEIDEFFKKEREQDPDLNNVDCWTTH